MGRYTCTRKERLTNSNIGSALIGIGVPLIVFPILTATGTFKKDKIESTFDGFRNKDTENLAYKIYFGLSITGTAITIAGITLDTLFLTAKTSD